MNILIIAATVITMVAPNMDAVNRTTERDLEKADLSKSVKVIEATFDEIHWSRFIDQMIRSNQLSIFASKIDAWVYASGIDEMIDDFEAARVSIEIAELMLQEEMATHGTLSASYRFGMEVDLVNAAQQELDRAELTIDMLIAIAMNEG